MSGGIDSALVATIAVDALGAKNVKLYALPSRFNSDSSMVDAKDCARNLDVELEVISIESAFSAMISTVYDYCGSAANSKAADLARENLQSRIRGQILMTISNATGALVLSTGNKSELATGYATLYGDMCGAFNPIKDIYKTQIYNLVKWRNQSFPAFSFYKRTNIIPQAIIIKEPTAELREGQKDSDSLPPYEILDKILFALIEERKSIVEIINTGFEAETVKKVAKLLLNSEYKRRQSVIGPKVSDMSFDKDRRYPITNRFS
jgi:NAD+ synthase